MNEFVFAPIRSDADQAIYQHGEFPMDDHMKQADARLLVLQRQRNDFADRCVVVEAALLEAQRKIAALEKVVEAGSKIEAVKPATPRTK